MPLPCDLPIVKKTSVSGPWRIHAAPRESSNAVTEASLAGE